MRPSRNQQINRALALLDRLITLIEASEDEPLVAEPKLPKGVVDRVQSRSSYWKDAEVRAAIVALYGRSSINEAAAILEAELGKKRAPGRSVLQRIYLRLAQEAAATN